MQINDWVKVILDSLYDGVLIADEKSVVKYVNPAYTRITNVIYEEIIERDLDQTRPGSLLPEVIRTGKKKLGVRRKMNDADYMVNMVPIIEKGRIIGGISILNEVNDVYKLVEELKKSNKIIKNLKDQMNRIGNAKYTFDDIVYRDKRSEETIQLARKISDKDMNVLITGESGTGKELFAQSIHNLSSRRDQPFLAVNCATLDNNLLESELFGYEEGSFTGAKKGGKVGLFEAANGGTVFLDEISEMDYKLQAKLLRVLQENVLRPVGGVSEVPVDVRVIAATNKNISSLIEGNTFREDLYYRISTFTINLYPLRERREDIIPLIENYLSNINEKSGKRIGITEKVLNLLYAYDWPGNVRELKNTIEYAAMMTDDDMIKFNNLPERINDQGIIKNLIELQPLEEIIKETEASVIRRALMKYGDSVESKKKIAKALGISLASLYNKLK